MARAVIHKTSKSTIMFRKIKQQLPCNLVIFFKARNHQQLLEQLRTLRESIECSWLQKPYRKKSGNLQHLLEKVGNTIVYLLDLRPTITCKRILKHNNVSEQLHKLRTELF